MRKRVLRGERLVLISFSEGAVIFYSRRKAGILAGGSVGN